MKKYIILLLFLMGLLLNFAYASQKIKICHYTHSSKNSYVVIEVDQSSLKAHLNHGDLLYDSEGGCIPESPQPY